MADLSTWLDNAGTMAKAGVQGPLIADGAMGTLLFTLGLPPGSCLEEAVLTRPELIAQVHGEYLAAGARLLLTHTFGGNRMRLKTYGLAERAGEINRQATTLLRKLANDRARVAGDIGPTGVKSGEASLSEVEAAYGEQAQALAQGGVEVFFLETFTNVTEIGIAIAACRRAAPYIPVMACVSPNPDGSLADGTGLEAWVARLNGAVDALGVNCFFGPAHAAPLISHIRGLTIKPLIFKPNAGLPMALEPRGFAAAMQTCVRAGANIIGGCCGTTPAFIRALLVTSF